MITTNSTLTVSVTLDNGAEVLAAPTKFVINIKVTALKTDSSSGKTNSTASSTASSASNSSSTASTATASTLSAAKEKDKTTETDQKKEVPKELTAQEKLE